MSYALAVAVIMVVIVGVAWSIRQKHWKAAGFIQLFAVYVVAINCVGNLNNYYQDIGLHLSEGEPGLPIDKTTLVAISINGAVLALGVIFLVGAVVCFLKSRGNGEISDKNEQRQQVAQPDREDAAG